MKSKCSHLNSNVYIAIIFITSLVVETTTWVVSFGIRPTLCHGISIEPLVFKMMLFSLTRSLLFIYKMRVDSMVYKVIYSFIFSIIQVMLMVPLPVPKILR